MIAEPLVEVKCAVCGTGEYRVVCSAREVQAQLAYLQRFHRKRLRNPSVEALADRADFTLDYATCIVARSSCGLLFRNPRPTSTAIEQAYSRDRYGHRRLSAMFDAQVELYRPKARMLARRLPEGSRVLEVGSFVGGFLAAGQHQGWDMLGVDPGEEVDTFCAERGLPVFRGTLPDLAHPGSRRGWEIGSVDCVAIWNAFDQLPRPEPTLAAARLLLKQGGILVLRVPNGACFDLATRWQPYLPWPLAGWLRATLAWNNLLAFPYLHGYTVQTLSRLLSRHGFRPVQVVPDTLCRLSDSGTKPWAAFEERLLKFLVRMAAKTEAKFAAGTFTITPWFDAYFRAI